MARLGTMVSWRKARVAIVIGLLALFLVVERDPGGHLLPDAAIVEGLSQTRAGSSNNSTASNAPAGAAPLAVQQQSVRASSAQCPGTSTIKSNFNGTAIAGTNYIWFNAVAQFAHVPTTGTTTITITGQKITWPSGSANLPNSTVTFDSAATSATTTYAGAWATTVPASYTGNVFIGGGFILASSGPPAGTDPVSWSAAFTFQSTVTVQGWKWAAAVYPSSTAGNNGGAGAKPVDGSNPPSAYNNSDHAGTPENFKTQVVGGARGGGGSNYTGSYSGTSSVC